MACSYYDATGSLTLTKITPVIEALYSNFNLNMIKTDSPSMVYVAEIAEDTDSAWSAMAEPLATFCDTINVDAVDEDVPTMLKAMVAHFHGDLVALDKCLEGIEFESDMVSFQELHTLALLMDDGHGLTTTNIEACWSSNRQSIGGFGGDATFISPHVSMLSSTSVSIAYASDLSDAIEAKDLVKASECLKAGVMRQLNQVKNEDLRKQLLAQLVIDLQG